MKNVLKEFGIIALVAVIGFSFAACGGDDSTTGNGGIAPTIITATLPNGVVNTAYSQTFTATGDTPITWSLESGTLPTGLNLLGSGIISGTPTTAGAFNFSVKAINISGSNTKQFSITITTTEGGSTQSIDGTWVSSIGMQITINGSTGVINQYGTLNLLSQDAVNKGYVKIGDQFWRNLISTGNLTWSGQQLGITYNTSSPNVATGTGWMDNTFTLSADGQKLTVGTAIYTRGGGGTAVTGVTLDQTSLNLTVGVTATLTATVAPSTATNKAVTWSSSNANVATVNSGTVTAVAIGNATITVTTADGGKTATCAVTVTSGGGSGGWTAVANSTFGTSDIKAIAYGGGKFVAGGSAAKMAYSSDGVTWTAVNTGTLFDYLYNGETLKAQIRGIAYGNGRFVAGSSYGGKMATSTDGITWTAVDSKFPTDRELCAIAWGNNKFVAVGDTAAYSSDGVTWTRMYDLYTIADTWTSAIAYGNNKFVAGSYGNIATSTDGVTWALVDATAIFGSKGSIYAIAFDGNGTFVAGGTDGKIAYSR